MLALLSPAKTLDFERAVTDEPTRARFAAEAGKIARAAARLGVGNLADLMHISPTLADLNHKRFKRFGRAEKRAAIHAFAGDVYRGFDAGSADSDTIAFAQDHVRILSGCMACFGHWMRSAPIGSRWEPTGRPTVVD